MTHAELVNAACKWLKKKRCIPVIAEVVCYNSSGEIPDAIGWTSRASILIECKMSRSDFFADRKKLWRYDLPEIGMGDLRFFFTNPGVIKSVEEIPAGWGVYECHDGEMKYMFGQHYSNACEIPLRGNKSCEVAILRSYIRRKEEGLI